MEKKNLDVQAGTQESCAPILQEKNDWEDAYFVKQTPFSASKREIALAVFMYIPAYIYLLGTRCAFPVFCALFVLMTEAFYRGTPHTKESWFWLSCAAVTAYAASFGRNCVWGDVSFLAAHAFAVYWVLDRSGRLLEGESGHLLPLDALFGLIVFPFKHFFLRIRTVVYALTHLRAGEKERPGSAMPAAAAVLAALVLLVLAVRNLSAADAAFEAAAARFLTAFRLEVNASALLRMALSLPVGAYLFGLIAGTGREERASVLARGERVNAALASLRKIPAAVWTAALGVFAALYLAFFGMQAGYLFGAFARIVPEGYTAAEYARQGFFSLCRVMAVNFALLWLVTRLGARPVREEKGTLILCAVLLVQSLVFAAIAASKLYLYIDMYGFTPRRLQSAWLIGVLAVGTVCALYSLVSGKKTVRYWMVCSAAAMTLLSLY